MGDERSGMLAGPKLLTAFLQKQGKTPYRFCLENGFDFVNFKRIIAGKRKWIHVRTAFQIERATKGEVPASSWIEPVPTWRSRGIE